MSSRQALGLTVFILPFLIWSCTSRSIQGERYSESSRMAAPSLSATIADPNNFSFAVVGDLHIAGQGTTRLKTIVEAAQKENDSFLICLGDVTDTGARIDVQSVKDALTSEGWLAKTLFVIGNHDIFYDGWTNFRDLFGPSHFAVTVGNSKFIAVDTADGSIVRDEREWLQNELKSSTSTNTFILSHYMPYTPGQRTYLRFADETEAISLMKLASTYNVHAWLGGHYHSYLNGNIDNVTYVVAGGGGGRRMAPVTSHFFVQVKVSGNQISYAMNVVD